MKLSAELFGDYPDVARVWVIATDRELESAEEDAVRARLADFFNAWESHGRKVVADCVIQHRRFILVAAYVPGDDVSGCGIDASVHELDLIGEQIGFARAPVLDVFFAGNAGVVNVDRGTFAELVGRGDVTEDTTVFDTSVSTLHGWRQGGFERPVSRSWHATAFF